MYSFNTSIKNNVFHLTTHTCIKVSECDQPVIILTCLYQRLHWTAFRLFGIFRYPTSQWSYLFSHEGWAEADRHRALHSTWHRQQLIISDSEWTIWSWSWHKEISMLRVQFLMCLSLSPAWTCRCHSCFDWSISRQTSCQVLQMHTLWLQFFQNA